MTTFILRRILIILPVLWVVLTLVFFSIHLVPGDPVRILLGDNGTQQDYLRLRHEMGLDQPIFSQYLDFIRGAVHMDFGDSIFSRQSVWHEIWTRFPYTAQLAGLAFLLSLILGLTFGVLAAVFNRTAIGTAITTFAVLGLSYAVFRLT